MIILILLFAWVCFLTNSFIISFKRSREEPPRYRLLNFLCSTSFALFASSLSLSLLAIIPWTFAAIHEIEIGRVDHFREIVSVRNQNDLGGQFFLGSGHVDSREYYYFFAKTDNHSLIREKIPSANCEIFQTNELSPRVTWQVVTYKLPSWFCPIEVKSYEETHRNLVVPEDTIIEEFELK